MGSNYLTPDQPGSEQWFFTPAESGWHSFGLFNNGPIVSVSLGDQVLGEMTDCGEAMVLKLQKDVQYTVTYAVEDLSTYNMLTVEKLPTLTGEQGTAEGGRLYMFQAEQEGYYWFLGSYGGVWDMETEEWLSFDKGEAIYLYPEKDYRIPVWDEGMKYQYLGEEVPYAALELDGEENPAGFYSFTPQQSGLYETNGYFEGEGISCEDRTETTSTYAFHKGETYYFYCRTPFTLTLLPRDPALRVYWNSLFVDEAGTTEWTFTPEVSGWYRFHTDTQSASVVIYDGEELINGVVSGEDIYLYLTEDTTYGVTFTITNTDDSESIYIDYYKPLSGLPQQLEGGSYTYTAEESGYYVFGKKQGMTVYDPSFHEEYYNHIGALLLHKGQEVLIQTYVECDVQKVQAQEALADGSTNPAGYYVATPEDDATYCFDQWMVFMNGVDGQLNGEWYEHDLSAGETYLYYAEEPFTLNVKVFDGSLREGYNFIPPTDLPLTFTPKESAWYRIDAMSGMVSVFDGETLMLDDCGYGWLESETTYAIEAESNELFVRKYRPVAEGAVVEEGYYAFIPEESGNYEFNGDSAYDTIMKTQPMWSLGEVELEAGRTYLFYLYNEGVVQKSTRVYTELTIDGEQKQAGYYTFTPQTSGRYSFSTSLEGDLNWSINDEETHVATFFAGVTYKFYAEEAFGVAMLPFGALEMGYNDIFGEANTDIAATFTPEADGLYSFNVYGESLKIYDGEDLVKDAQNGLFLVQLQAGTTYNLTFRYYEYQYGPYVEIYQPSVLTQTEEIEYGRYLFTPDETAWYQFPNLSDSVYDIASGESCPMEMGAYELEEGKTYFINGVEGSIIKEERVYTNLSITDDQKAAGYYSFVAPSSGFYAFSSEIYLGNCNYYDLGFDADLEAYIYLFYQGKKVQFYAGEAFYVSRLPDPTALHEEHNHIFGQAEEILHLTFTPSRSGWFMLDAYDGSEMEIYQGETLLKEPSSVLQVYLAENTTYQVNLTRSENDDDDVEGLFITKYEELEFAQGNEYQGLFVFTPEESGYYSFEEIYNAPYNATDGEWVEIEMGESNLQAGKTYLIEIYGAMFYLGEREYTELTIDDAVKPAGYYTYSPSFSAGYVFSEEVRGLYDYHYDGDTVVYKMYANNTYKFYAPDPFTVTKLEESTVLKEGSNYLYAEIDEVGEYTFTPAETAWYEIYNNDEFCIYQGDVLLKEGKSSTEFLKLQADTAYTIRVERKMDPNYDNPAIYIERYRPLDQVDEIPAGAWVIGVEQSGYYKLSDAELMNWGMTIYNGTDGCAVRKEVDAVYLESGKEYLIWIVPYYENFALTYVGEREYTALTLDRRDNPAGFYTFTPEQNVFLALSEAVNGSWGWGSEVDGWDVFFCEGGETYTFYAEKEFDAMDFGDFLYEENNDGTIYLTEYVGNNPDIVIPGTLNGKSVKQVCMEAFFWHFNEKEDIRITVGDGVEVLEEPRDYEEQVRVLELNATVTLKKAQFSEEKPLVLIIPAERTDLDIFDANAPANVSHIFYGGTEQQWSALKATDPTGTIANAIVHCNSTKDDYTIAREGGALSVLCELCGTEQSCSHESTYTENNTCNTERITYCNLCGEEIGREALGAENATHTLGELITDKAATCGKAGKGHRNCVDCGTLVESNITIPATGKHKAGSLITDKAATCGKAGKGHKNCTVCGALVASNIIINATGKHVAGGWKTTQAATYEAEGLDTKYCITCDKVMETRTVDKLIKAETVFEDVKEDDWYHDAVSYAYSNNLFKGVSENDFAPAQEMTRAMLVTVLWRYAGEPKGGSHSFKDVPKGEWYTEAVAWAAKTGVVNGTSADTFDPNAIITREQMATILYRYAKSTGLNVSGSANIGGFKDGSKVNAWAKEGMQWAVGKKLINGSSIDGIVLLDPSNGATRGQVATILMRYIENIVKA